MIPRHVPALALGTLALGVAEFSMMSILLPVADDLGVTVPEAGHFISAYAAGVCAGVLIMAAAARKMPLKTLLLIIVGIITLGNTLTVFEANRAKHEPWLVLGAIGLGNGGFFAYYSYVNPVMEHVAAVPASMMSVVITLAGAGMVLGNLFCAKISSSFSDESLAAAGQGVLLLSLASVFFLAHWSPAAIALTTLAAGCVFFISGPEQVLMIRNAKEGQLLAASLAQVSFNAGNAVGAWLGGLPIDAGKAANWAAMPGFFLALAGFGLLFVNWLIHRVREEERTAGRIAALQDQIQSKMP